MTPRVAIVYFGLTRSLPDTIDSMKKHVFYPILASGMEYDIYMHTYVINGPYHNRWSEENLREYDNEQYLKRVLRRGFNTLFVCV
jgi:hypothetical protein